MSDLPVVGQRVMLPGRDDLLLVYAVTPVKGGVRLVLQDDQGNLVAHEVAGPGGGLLAVSEDGGGEAARVLGGAWASWMLAASAEARASLRATRPLRPYPHQTTAVYGAMLTQPRLRFLLADEPGTGKTIMAGMLLREMQRLGIIRRALVVVPAHLVSKWQADFERFFGGGLRRITSATVREQAIGLGHDAWVVSLDLAAANPAVQDAIRPDRAGWDLVIFDEAHRLTPTAETFYRVGKLLASKTERALLMTATPHRGKEWLFRSLMHLVDPELFPSADPSQPLAPLRPPSSHFLRRMKEDLVDHDGAPLFKGRRAQNLRVDLNLVERAAYADAQELVEQYFPESARALAATVYGKRAASSLYALSETLMRRRNRMGSALGADAEREVDPEDEDSSEREEARVVVADSLSATAERRAIDALLARLRPAAEDEDVAASKLQPAVRVCLGANGIQPGGSQQAVIFTEFADTADWLVRRLRREGFTAERYSGRDSHARRDEVRSRFANGDFQLLVSTDAGNEGIDLQTAHVLVNWDIPWSLVRLEQRMGRIHRVGQTRDVELFNLVATDTREGEVLHTLLENFVLAANRLGGKMFDSLSLVGEQVGLGDLEDTLSSTFHGEDARRHALDAVRAITAERIEREARRLAEQEDQLRSVVDLAEAEDRLRTETLERINPEIVAAFLRRIDGVTCKVAAHANEGFYLLRGLPGRLGWGEDALTAVSAAAVDDARGLGSAVPDVIVLGPAERPFRELAELTSAATTGDVFRGGTLEDPSSLSDYFLAWYEATVEEGSRPPSTWRTLVRVDGAGARSVRWELLANLRCPSQREVRALHPANATRADEAATAAAEAERDRRAVHLRRWFDDTRQTLQRLPFDQTRAIENPDARKAARDRLRSAVEARIAELERNAIVSFGGIRRVGWASVRGTADPRSMEQPDSEMIAMRFVDRHLRGEGWQVSDVHNEGRGYDLYAQAGRRFRCVEVKGLAGAASSSGIVLTGNELLVARQMGENFWLVVVDQCTDGLGRLFAEFRNPAALFGDIARDIPLVRIPGSALTQAKERVAAQ